MLALKRKYVVPVTVAAMTLAAVALPRQTHAEGPACDVIYDNYKISITLFPDEHGHKGEQGQAPGSPWQFVLSAFTLRDYVPHDEFIDDGYANTSHTYCNPS